MLGLHGVGRLGRPAQHVAERPDQLEEVDVELALAWAAGRARPPGTRTCCVPAAAAGQLLGDLAGSAGRPGRGADPRPRPPPHPPAAGTAAADLIQARIRADQQVLPRRVEVQLQRLQVLEVLGGDRGRIGMSWMSTSSRIRWSSTSRGSSNTSSRTRRQPAEGVLSNASPGPCPAATCGHAHSAEERFFRGRQGEYERPGRALPAPGRGRAARCGRAPPGLKRPPDRERRGRRPSPGARPRGPRAPSAHAAPHGGGAAVNNTSCRSPSRTARAASQAPLQWPRHAAGVARCEARDRLAGAPASARRRSARRRSGARRARSQSMSLQHEGGDAWSQVLGRLRERAPEVAQRRRGGLGVARARGCDTCQSASRRSARAGRGGAAPRRTASRAPPGSARRRRRRSAVAQRRAERSPTRQPEAETRGETRARAARGVGSSWKLRRGTRAARRGRSRDRPPAAAPPRRGAQGDREGVHAEVAAQQGPARTSGSAPGARVDLAALVYPRPGALPEVRAGSLGEDLLRRDFSVNALAIPLSAAARRGGPLVVDPASGLADLEAGVLRVLHARSFHDDPTRALRAARLAPRLGFRLARSSGERSARRCATAPSAASPASASGRSSRSCSTTGSAASTRHGRSACSADWHVLGALEPGLGLPAVRRGAAAPPRARARGAALVLAPRSPLVCGLMLWLAPAEPALRRRALRRLALEGAPAAGDRAASQSSATRGCVPSAGRGVAAPGTRPSRLSTGTCSSRCSPPRPPP